MWTAICRSRSCVASPGGRCRRRRRRAPPAAGAGAARAGGELRGHQRGRRLGRRDAVVLGVEPPPGWQLALYYLPLVIVERVGVLVRRRPLGISRRLRHACRRAGCRRSASRSSRPTLCASSLVIFVFVIFYANGLLNRGYCAIAVVFAGGAGAGSDRRHLLPLPADLRAGAAAAAAGFGNALVYGARAEAVQRVRLAPSRAPPPPRLLGAPPSPAA